MLCAGCSSGSYRSGCSGTLAGSCVACESGKFKSSAGSGECLACASCNTGVRSGCGGSLPGSCVEQSTLVTTPAPATSPSSLPSLGAGVTADVSTSIMQSTGGAEVVHTATASVTTPAPTLASPTPAPAAIPSSEAAVQSVVELTVKMPMSKADFVAKQADFVAAVAASARVAVDDVKIVSVTESLRRGEERTSNRRLLAATVTVVSEIATAEPAALSNSLTSDSINDGLAAKGLPSVTSFTSSVKSAAPSPSPSAASAAALPTPDPDLSGGVNVTVIALISSAGSLALLFACAFARGWKCVAHWRGHQVDNTDRSLKGSGSHRSSSSEGAGSAASKLGFVETRDIERGFGSKLSRSAKDSWRSKADTDSRSNTSNSGTAELEPHVQKPAWPADPLDRYRQDGLAPVKPRQSHSRQDKHLRDSSSAKASGGSNAGRGKQAAQRSGLQGLRDHARGQAKAVDLDLSSAMEKGWQAGRNFPAEAGASRKPKHKQDREFADRGVSSFLNNASFDRELTGAARAIELAKKELKKREREGGRQGGRGKSVREAEEGQREGGGWE